MKVFVKIFFLLCFFSASVFSQYYQSGIDTVISFKPGAGQNFGQDPKYYPQNIFGLPDTNASENIPSASPEQILSLGLGGEIVVAFKNYVLVDAPGYDFTIFENAFINPLTGKIFAEPAKIACSYNGVNFIEIPFDSLTLEGCAGTKPTNGKENPFDPAVSGGNSFDLATIGLEKVRYIKITDICQMILDNPSHPFYDPIISGFDLDAVVGLHLLPDNTASNISELFSEKENFCVFFNGNNLLIYKIIENNLRFSIEIFDIYGRIVLKDEAFKFIQINLENFTNGIYLMHIYNSNEKIIKLINKGINACYTN